MKRKTKERRRDALFRLFKDNDLKRRREILLQRERLGA